MGMRPGLDVAEAFGESKGIFDGLSSEERVSGAAHTESLPETEGMDQLAQVSPLLVRIGAWGPRGYCLMQGHPL